MAAEDITFKINVEGAAAKRELDALRGSAETLGGGMGKLNASLVEQSMRVEQLRSKQLELAQALSQAGNAATRDAALVGALRQELERTTGTLNAFAGAQGRVTSRGPLWQQNFGALTTGAQSAGKSFWTLEGASKGLQQRLAPQAAAISSISAALGENSGQVGKVVAGAGQLAAAFAAGGPLGAALAAAGVGVTLLVQHWDDLIKKQDEYLAKQFLATDDAGALRLKVGVEVAALQAELSEVGLTQREKNISGVNREIAAIENKISAMRVEGKIWTDNEVKAQGILEGTIRALRNKQMLSGRVGGIADGTAAEAAAKAASADAKRAVIEEDRVRAHAFGERLRYAEGALDIEEAAAERLADVRAEQFSQRMSLDDWATAKAAENEERLTDVHAEQAARRLALDEWAAKQTQDVLDKRMQMWAQTFSSGISATSSFVGTLIQAQAAKEAAARDGSIAGVMAAEETKRQAFAMSAASFMSAIGGQIVGEGILSVVKGSGMVLTPGMQGPGALLLAQGAGAIALGMSLGAAGTAITAGAGNAVSGAGARGAAIDNANAESDRGVNSGSRSGGRGGSQGGSSGGGTGGRTIVINYGVMGPQPDETARAIARLSSRASARGFTEDGARRGR